MKSYFAERLRLALDARNMKQSELVQKTGIPKSAISHYVNGLYEPKQERLYLISKAVGFSPAWLMGYDIDLEKETIPSNAEIVKVFNKLTDEQQGQVLAFIRFLSEGSK
jgi:transcriptional regulator with XRE-family HTH domain